MTSTQLTPAAPFRNALAALLRAARALAGPPRQPSAPACPACAPPSAASYSPVRTLEWVVALVGILAGDPHFQKPLCLRFAGREPALTARLRADIGLNPLPPRTEAQRKAARLHYMRRVLATEPTGRLAARLARRMGLSPGDAAWPHALIGIGTPPARLCLPRRDRPAPLIPAALIEAWPQCTRPATHRPLPPGARAAQWMPRLE